MPVNLVTIQIRHVPIRRGRSSFATFIIPLLMSPKILPGPKYCTVLYRDSGICIFLREINFSGLMALDKLPSIGTVGKLRFPKLALFKTKIMGEEILLKFTN